MTTFSAAKGRKVVSIANATTVGKVGDFIVDPAQRRIEALSLKKTSGNGDTLPWASIVSFGEDAITIAHADALVPADEHLSALAAKAHAIRGKRVLTTAGEDLGEVKDLEFDPATGMLARLHLKEIHLPGDDLISAGSYAVIVRAAG